MDEHPARTIILPVGEEEHGRTVGDKRAYRDRVCELMEMHPELFPDGMADGFSFVGYSANSSKLPVRRRLVRLGRPAGPCTDYLLHPCFVMPYLRGRTSEVSAGLWMRKHNLPYHAIASLAGRNAMYWYEAEMSLSRFNIVGATVKGRRHLPRDILVDEHHTSLGGGKAYVCTTVGAGCFLGADVSPTMESGELSRAYGRFREEARTVCPGYCPDTVNTDGYKSTRKAVRHLFPGAADLRCFLHSFLKVRNCGTKAHSLYFAEVARRIWHCYRAEGKQSFSQRVTYLRKWAEQVVPPSPFRTAVLQLCQKKGDFLVHYDHPGGMRTSNMLDRLMKYQDRRLYCTQDFHGTLASARAAVRAHALLMNFCPYSPQTIAKKGGIYSPFQQLNGFRYREDWLENLLVAASLNGNRPFI